MTVLAPRPPGLVADGDLRALAGSGMSGCFASSRSGWQEICAYGTAVKIRPLTDPTALHTTTSA